MQDHSVDLETYWSLEKAIRKLINIEVSCMMGAKTLKKAREHIVATSKEGDVLSRFYPRRGDDELMCKAHNSYSCPYCE